MPLSTTKRVSRYHPRWMKMRWSPTGKMKTYHKVNIKIASMNWYAPMSLCSWSTLVISGEWLFQSFSISVKERRRIVRRCCNIMLLQSSPLGTFLKLSRTSSFELYLWTSISRTRSTRCQSLSTRKRLRSSAFFISTWPTVNLGNQ